MCEMPRLPARRQVWEQAAVVVAAREELLASLSAVQLGVEDGSISALSVGALERQCISLMQVGVGGGMFFVGLHIFIGLFLYPSWSLSRVSRTRISSAQILHSSCPSNNSCPLLS